MFAGLAWLLTLALKRNRAQVRYAVRLAASAKFIVPFTVLVGLGSQVHWRAAPAMKREAQPSVDWMPELLLLVWAAGFVAIGMKWGRRWTQMNSDGGRLASGKLRPSS